jgi:2-dehydro-3-deoxygluconokinase
MVRWRPSGAHGHVTYYRRDSAGSHLVASDIPAEVVRDADVVFAGELEAEIVTGTSDPLQAALALEQMAPTRPRQVVIKRGAAGCLARLEGATFEQPAPAVAVVDTVGAGDAFVAGYLTELMGGAAPAERLRTAVAAGAFAVTVSGDWEGMPDRAALALLEATDPVVR